MAVVKKISELTAKGSNIGANDLVIVGVSNGTDYDLKSVTGNQLIGAAIAQTITNGVTTTAPSQDAVFDALALKVDTVVGSRLITSAEGTKLSNLSGVNTGDQDLSGYQPLLSGGTTNRLTKWSSSSAITSSLIQDNGTTLSIGTTPVANNLFKVSSNATDTTLVSENSQASGVGISGSSSGANGIGGSFTSTSVTGVKIGVNASSTGAGGTNKGAVFGATNGATNYSIQLTDGTEGSGKFLKSVTANGESNWASISNTDVSGLGTLATQSTIPVVIQLACSDETTALTTGTSKVTFRMPHAMTLTAVRASLNVAGTTSGITTIDINEGGTSILSTKLTIDLTEKTSTTAVTAPVISDASLADDAEITIDIDAISGGATEKGLKITLIGTRTV